MSSALGAQSVNHWTTREVPNYVNLALIRSNAVNHHLSDKQGCSHLHFPKGKKEMPHLGKEVPSNGETSTSAGLTCTPTPQVAQKQVFNIQGKIIHPDSLR